MQANSIVDLRSDTVTKPGAEMRRAMAEAEVGDDVYGEDPTVRRLEETAAALVGHEDAVFVPTGTMGNQVAINLHSPAGTEVIVESGSHVYNYELAAMTAWSGVLPRVLSGRNGMLDADQVRQAISPPVYYMAPTSALLLENTHNHAGGTVLPMDRKNALLGVAREGGLKVHLDGARIFNAASALGLPAARLAEGVDSVMFCLSKGLGAPVGSVLCGKKDWLEEARVVRKRMGGGMRQVGVLAAAGLVGLERNVDRLVEDHARARRLAEALADLSAFQLDPDAVETNIVIAEVRPPHEVGHILEELRRKGLLAGPMGPGRVRFVTHLDVDDAELDRAIETIRACVAP
jgi:threonine aldolase